MTDIAFLGKTRLDTPSISPADRNFLLGDGCFETLRATSDGVEGVDEHFVLLTRSAETLGISGFPDPSPLSAALQDIAAGLDGDASIRITLSRGAGGRGADAGASEPLTLLSCTPLPTSRPYPPLAAITSSIRRNDTSPISRIKSTSYGDNLAARREAMSLQADEALMLNTKGRPACFAMGNLFLTMPDGEWLTPPESEGIRPGFMRSRVLSALKETGITARIRPIEPQELAVAGAALYATNSLWGLRPVSRLDATSYVSDMPPIRL